MKSKIKYNFSVYHKMQNYYIFHKTGNGNSNFSFQNFMAILFLHSTAHIISLLYYSFKLRVFNLCNFEMLLLIFLLRLNLTNAMSKYRNKDGATNVGNDVEQKIIFKSSANNHEPSSNSEQQIIARFSSSHL